MVDDNEILRDMMAAHALQGMLARERGYKPKYEDRNLDWPDAIAKEAYQIADAMMKARDASRGN